MSYIHEVLLWLLIDCESLRYDSLLADHLSQCQILISQSF